MTSNIYRYDSLSTNTFLGKCLRTPDPFTVLREFLLADKQTDQQTNKQAQNKT